MSWKNWICPKCEHFVMAQERPVPISWDDGHTCRFIETDAPPEEEVVTDKQCRYMKPGTRTERTWTAYLIFDPESDQYEEEIDVRAANVTEARKVVEAALKKDYDAGLTIGEIEERFGLYL
jgi:hypothetical protein